ncbi:kelch repeat-containing protein [Anguilla anguilla]|uniref:kelch repeat-containing protein n=1 Tax=Anguilla anguilla TaxID=7936 RepID=UPI0015A97239|nr:kelch repeat-containing protein [Anguilla anguilla]
MMDCFNIYVVFGVNDPPQRLIRTKGRECYSIAVPSAVQQMVVFSNGRWEKRTVFKVELTDPDKGPITLGNLTPESKCILWECWEGNAGDSGLTLTASLEGASPVKEEFADPHFILSKKESTPKFSGVPASVREAPGKRKRGQEEDQGVGTRGQENVCPNSSPSEKSTPRRTVRGSVRSNHKELFTHNTEQADPCEPQGHKVKGKQARVSTQTVSLANPSGRWGQTLCPIDPQTAILIGGQGSRMQFCKDPMWKLCTEDMSWVPAETLAEGPTPEGRIGHTATFDPESRRIFVFGGSKNKKWFNDVHILDTRSWRWTMVEAQGKVPPLAYHSCSLFRGELFVLGGVFPRPHPKPDGCSDSLYIFNPEMAIWYQPIVNGDRPAPRSGHSACVLQGKIFLFGGWDTPVCFNDMHMLDLGLMEFSPVKTNGTPPSPRSWHGCAVLSDSKFLVHGGYNGNDALADTFIFDTASSSWTTVVNPSLSAVPRAGHSIITMANTYTEESMEDEEQIMGLEPCPQTLLIFGGGDNEGSFFSDLTTLLIDEVLN